MSNLDILAPFGCLGRGFLHCSKDGLPCKVGAQVGVSGVGPGAGGVGICQDRLQGRGQRGRGGAFQVGSVGPIGQQLAGARRVGGDDGAAAGGGF